MRLLVLTFMSFHIVKVLSRKYVSSSDESIENLLYYKDCQRKPKTTPKPTRLRSTYQPTPEPRQPDCPFPKMCCSMSCGNDCGSPQSYLSRQMEPLQKFEQMNFESIQPPRQPQLAVQPKILQRTRKKKFKPTPGTLLPIGARRDSGFTKERIKSLISQDEDIRKILKDLVRVTMKKVDLLELLNNGRNNNLRIPETSINSEEYQ